MFILVRSSLLITLFKCLKGHKAQGSLCMSKSKSSLSVVSEVVTGVGIELSQTRSGQLKRAKTGYCLSGGEDSPPQFIQFSQKFTRASNHLEMDYAHLEIDPHIYLHTCKQGGLICRIWDWQSTIVKDLNDIQDPKHTLFCRKNTFVAIHGFFLPQTTNIRFLPVWGEGRP